jgi:DNA ligase-1
MGDWEPSAEWYTRLVAPAEDGEDWRRPYPFFLASPYDGEPSRIGEALGDADAWHAEWKWDGIRVQCVRRRDSTLLWSRGEELLAGRFPEIEEGAAFLPNGTVLDGELLAWDVAADRPQPFTALQRRINRRTVGRTLLRDVPCRVLVYDCLEFGNDDVRVRPLHERRALAERVVQALPTGAPFAMSPVVAGSMWHALAAARDTAREQLAEGLMLKRAESAYGTGRRGGEWIKWKVVPHTVDAVLVYAQAGHGRRAGLYTDYTLAVWDGDALVPFAKAYSGLTDAEIREVDRFVRAHTEERFGPVRTVTPTLVFELAFEAIQRSTRHKSGIAVRFPRIARWRRDKGPRDANTLDDVRALLPAETA